MARRKHSGEVNIGSDSFLDVIANIVGILIILIVIAGVRVSRAPAPKKKPAPVIEEVVAAPEIPQPVPEPEPEEADVVETTQPPVELTQQIQSLQSEIDQLEAKAAATEASKSELEQRQASGELEIAAGRQALQTESTQLEGHERSLAEMQALIAAQQNNLKLLQAQIKELNLRAPKVQKLKHRVTPVSRVVVGDQIHFRLSGNHVSQVPIHELLQAAMRQAKHQGGDLAHTRKYLGTAGPIGGYLLQYKLEAVPASASETARYGPGMVRVALTSFQLDPEPDIREETAEQALRKGSMFDVAIQTAEPGATFTLWVYPDSFQLYRQLQNHLHELGFTVAARPLPKGIPIAGSPEGSASAGQ